MDLLEEYTKIVGFDVIDQLKQLSKPLQGLKMVHINSTRMGGGVAEILEKMLPLTRALGIDAQWEVMEGSPEFYQCTKNFHNAIQGNRVFIPPILLQAYETINEKNAEKLNNILNEADVVLIHDPQPLALINYYKKRKGKWVWRCHIDASNPFKTVWNYLTPLIKQYDASVFSLAEFAHPLPHPMFIIPPSIDPLSEKNIDLEQKEIEETVNLYGLDPMRPIILQVSRFDRFKDPLGVIETYQLVKKFNPTVQLMLAGSEASDDPEGAMVLEEIRAAVQGESDIHVLLLPPNAHRTINALQRGADIVLQKSIREGFGLTVTEALWKRKPVIGGNTGGIKLQVIDYQTGFLVNTPEGAAYRIRFLLQNPYKIKEMGIKAREYVREKFLNTRHLREYLTLVHSLCFGTDKDRIEL